MSALVDDLKRRLRADPYDADVAEQLNAALVRLDRLDELVSLPADEAIGRRCLERLMAWVFEEMPQLDPQEQRDRFQAGIWFRLRRGRSLPEMRERYELLAFLIDDLEGPYEIHYLYARAWNDGNKEKAIQSRVEEVWHMAHGFAEQAFTRSADDLFRPPQRRFEVQS